LGRPVPAGDDGLAESLAELRVHSSELARWDQVCPAVGETDADPGRALKGLIVAGVRAAVVAPERELRRWFSWQWYWPGTLVDDLIGEQQLRRVDGHVTTPEPKAAK
jgi:hypothetical protein